MIEFPSCLVELSHLRCFYIILDVIVPVIQQPLRAKHCDDCRRCVYKYDHHCPWLDACIGEQNHKFFWLFLLFQTALVVWALVITWFVKFYLLTVCSMRTKVKLIQFGLY